MRPPPDMWVFAFCAVSALLYSKYAFSPFGCFKKRKDEYIAVDSSTPMFDVVPCTANGDCFFEAIGRHLGIGARKLRQECALAYTNDLEPDEQTTMAASENVSRQMYQQMLMGRLFGGHNEMVLIANRFNANIHMYVRPHITHYTSVRPTKASCTHSTTDVYILWDGRAHYDCLIHR